MDIFSAIEGKVMTATLYINDVAVENKSKFLGDENSQEYKDYINDYYYEKYPIPDGKTEYEKSMFDDGNMIFYNNSNSIGYYYEFENATAYSSSNVSNPLPSNGEKVCLIEQTGYAYFEINSEIETDVMFSINMFALTTNDTNQEFSFDRVFEVWNAEDYDAFITNSGNTNYHSINLLPNNITFYVNDEAPEHLILYRLGEIHLREELNIIRLKFGAYYTNVMKNNILVIDSIMLSKPTY